MINKFNPWHHVPPYDKSPEIVNGIIEISKGTRAKYELDQDSGLLKLDRVLFSSVIYPVNYGFIPQSFCDDNDPLDILILSQIHIASLCLVPAKVIGVMKTIDNGEIDDKIIAVAAGDPSVNHFSDIKELPPHFLPELRNFFEEYKKLENKTVVVKEFSDKQTAIKILQDSFKMYSDRFKKNSNRHLTSAMAPERL